MVSNNIGKKAARFMFPQRDIAGLGIEGVRLEGDDDDDEQPRFILKGDDDDDEQPRRNLRLMRGRLVKDDSIVEGEQEPDIWIEGTGRGNNDCKTSMVVFLI